MTDTEAKKISDRLNKYEQLKNYLIELEQAIISIENKQVVKGIQPLGNCPVYMFKHASIEHEVSFCTDVLNSLKRIRVDVKRELEEM